MAAIARVEVGRFDYDLIGDFKFFKNGVRPTVVVRLTDENGLHGYGQSVPVETWTYETVESVETTLRRYIAPAIVGVEPADLAAVHARMERAIRPSFSVGQPLCKAAVDLACYDLWGRQTGRSASDLLGGAKRDTIKLSWTVQAPTLESAEQQLALGRAHGYDSFNVKLGYPQTPDYDIALVRDRLPLRAGRFPLDRREHRLRSRDGARDRAEAGGCRHHARWSRRSRRTASATIRRLRRQGALPILMDEGIVSPVEVEEFIALNMFDGIAMKVARCGGLASASRIVHLLAEQRSAAVRIRADRSRSVARRVVPSVRVGRFERPGGAQRSAIYRRPGIDRSGVPPRRRRAARARPGPGSASRSIRRLKTHCASPWSNVPHGEPSDRLRTGSGYA